MLKLGKKVAVVDPRTLQADRVLRIRPLPAVWDVDWTHPSVPTPMFMNDQLGCCVIAARAHQTLRFGVEHAAVPAITDQDIATQYFKETNGEDAGLVMLYSLRAWRQDGWTAARDRDSIAAFTGINPHRPGELKSAIFSLTGAHLGIEMPITAMRQFEAGQPWTALDEAVNSDARRGSLGGHAVYICGWDDPAQEYTVVTWGKKHRVSYGFIAKYCSEAWGVLDSIDVSQQRDDVVDVAAVRDYLASLTTGDALWKRTT